MAVATLERNLETQEDLREIKVNKGFNTQMSAEEQHNARIGEIYARLVGSSNANVDEVLGRRREEVVPAPQKDLFANSPALVRNARADSEIFRADSPINRRVMHATPVAVQAEEENEDLRPTSATIQYKTNGVNKTVEEGKVANTGVEKRAGLSKKEKVIIAVVVSAIIAMFVLIIVNSAVISVINADLGSLQSSLTTVKNSYAQVSGEVNDLLSNATKNAIEFANSIGMVN